VGYIGWLLSQKGDIDSAETLSGSVDDRKHSGLAKSTGEISEKATTERRGDYTGTRWRTAACNIRRI